MKINKKLLTGLGMMAASAAIGESMSDSVGELETPDADDLEGLEDIDVDVEDVEVDVEDVDIENVQVKEVAEEHSVEAGQSNVPFKAYRDYRDFKDIEIND